jgi:rhodanese-related sulfurtransferase
VSDTIDGETLARDMTRFQVVDVRYANEWDAGRIENAVHIPVDDVLDRVDELDRARPVVTVCRTGSRSAEAAKDLADEGFDVQNLAGGMQAWVAEGRPIVAADGSPGVVVEPEPTPDDRPERMQRLQAEFLDVIFAVQEHFGDREASEEEMQAFLRQRLIDEGKTPEEADEFLEAMNRPGT